MDMGFIKSVATITKEEYERDLTFDPAVMDKVAGKKQKIRIDKSGKTLLTRLPKGPLAEKAMLETHILGGGEGVAFNTRWSKRSLNTLVLASDKDAAENHVLPNILQANASIVIEDAGKALYKKTGEYLEKMGYKVITTDSEIDIKAIGQEKTALFVAYQDKKEVGRLYGDIMDTLSTGINPVPVKLFYRFKMGDYFPGLKDRMMTGAKYRVYVSVMADPDNKKEAAELREIMRACDHIVSVGRINNHKRALMEVWEKIETPEDFEKIIVLTRDYMPLYLDPKPVEEHPNYRIYTGEEEPPVKEEEVELVEIKEEPKAETKETAAPDVYNGSVLPTVGKSEQDAVSEKADATEPEKQEEKVEVAPETDINDEDIFDVDVSEEALDIPEEVIAEEPEHKEPESVPAEPEVLPKEPVTVPDEPEPVPVVAAEKAPVQEENAPVTIEEKSGFDKMLADLNEQKTKAASLKEIVEAPAEPKKENNETDGKATEDIFEETAARVVLSADSDSVHPVLLALGMREAGYSVEALKTSSGSMLYRKGREYVDFESWSEIRIFLTGKADNVIYGKVYTMMDDGDKACYIAVMPRDRSSVRLFNETDGNALKKLAGADSLGDIEKLLDREHRM